MSKLNCNGLKVKKDALLVLLKKKKAEDGQGIVTPQIITVCQQKAHLSKTHLETWGSQTQS